MVVLVYMSISLQIWHLIHASIRISMKIFTLHTDIYEDFHNPCINFFILFIANVRDMPKYIQVLNKWKSKQTDLIYGAVVLVFIAYLFAGLSLLILWLQSIVAARDRHAWSARDRQLLNFDCLFSCWSVSVF
jgi:hypothetical protein